MKRLVGCALLLAAAIVYADTDNTGESTIAGFGDLHFSPAAKP